MRHATLLASATLLGVLALVCSASAEEPQAAGPGPAANGASGSLFRALKPDWALADHIYYEPLLAEQRAARLFLLFPGWSKEFPHSQERGNRFAWQVTMGREIPLLGWVAGKGASDINQRSPFEKGQGGFGIWLPIAFHVIEDFKDESNPIVDTDYRFGVMLKSQIGLPWQSRLGIRFVPWAHESTHLGDEYTILASERPNFERINVSYEYWEYGVSYEKAFSPSGLLKLRHGGIMLWGDDGYYSDHLLHSPPTLSVSQKNYEPSFGVEYRHPTMSGRQVLLSLDFRHRLQYSFHHPASGEEVRRPTWTIAIGHAAIEDNTATFRSIFVHLTHGVNPFGQLREQYPYWAAGLGFTFDDLERTMDYDTEILLIALVAHRRFGGSAEASLTTFTTNLFDRFNAHIANAEAALNPPLNAPLSAKDRSVVAAIASMFGGLPQDAVTQALTNFRRLFAR